MGIAVAIIGRPNVGKSTLFNRLVGRALALVDDTPGVTRDRRMGEAQLGPLHFTAIDTAGLDDVVPDGGAIDDDTQTRIRAQTGRALEAADVVLFVIDGKTGVTPLDETFAGWLRRGDVPVIVVVNKTEGRAGGIEAMDAYRLGLGDPVAISAKHGEGMEVLYEALAPFAEAGEDEEAEEDPVARDDGEGEPVGPISLAIVGRPNTGKSTLINRLLNEERVVTGPEAGLTRDAIAVDWTHAGRAIRLIDTAGLRRRARVVDPLEKLATADSLRALRYAQVVALVLDATVPLERQEQTIAAHTAKEGRALLVVANKWDQVDDKQATLKRLRDQLENDLTQVRGLRFVPLSALTGAGMGKLMPAVLDVYEKWNVRISTGRLNRWFADVIAYHPPPAVSGRRLKLRYITQIKSRPPTFVLFTTRPADLPDAYTRYLVNGIREAFDLPGVPIRLLLRKGKNPYVKD